MAKSIASRAFLLGLALLCHFCLVSLGASTYPIAASDMPTDPYFYLNHHYNASYGDPNPVSHVGKTVFVSGITHGQGPEIARQFYEAGVAQVIGLGTSADAPPSFISQALFYRVNMSNAAEVDEMVRSIYEDHGITKIDIFVGNAGRMYNGYTQDNTAEDHMRLTDNNCEGNFRLYETFDRFGMIDHQDHETVIMFTASIAHCSNLGDGLGPYASSKSCVVQRINHLVDTAVQNGWKETYRTLSPFGVFTNIGNYQFYPYATQLVCKNQTEELEAQNSNTIDPYGPNPYDETTVIDIGMNYVMMASYRSPYDPQFNVAFKIGLHTHFVIKADYPLDAQGLGDWDFWCPAYNNMNHLRYSQLIIEAGFLSFYPGCTAVHTPHVDSPSASPSVSLKGHGYGKPKKSPKAM